MVSRGSWHGLAWGGIWNIQKRLEHCYQVFFELLLGGGCALAVDSCPVHVFFAKFNPEKKIISRVSFHGLALEGIWNIQERLEHCYQVFFELLLGGGCALAVDNCPVHVFFAKFNPEKKIILRESFHGLAWGVIWNIQERLEN